MEVTNENFEAILPEIRENIKNATFLSIDCEFSGLSIVSEINAYDTIQQYYNKIYKNCRDFLIIQFGLSLFKFDTKENSFNVKTYNFYIFRRPINNNIPDQRFLCQTSSIHFLMQQGFDFNKLFKFGIPYLNRVEEAMYRENLERKKQQLQATQTKTNESIPIPEDSKPFINDILRKLEEFLENDEIETLDLPKCNAFLRRLIFQIGREKYGDCLHFQTKKIENNDRCVLVTKFKTQQDLERIENRLVGEEMGLFENSIGFAKILRIIIESEKLVIGHNLCLDLLHIVDKFLTPLPHDYNEFKDCLHSLLPNVLDTKFLANSDIFKELITSTILKDLLETIRKEPFKLPQINSDNYQIDDNKEHEAGYDAYITGLCFISLWYYLGKQKQLNTNEIFNNFNLIEPFKNRVYLSILRDNQFIYLSGDDPQPSRDHVFYLTFPKEWKLTNIIELFSPFGNVYVAWLSDTSAYVGLNKREYSNIVLNTITSNDIYTITSYKHRQDELKLAKITNSTIIKRKRTAENDDLNCKKFKNDSSSSSSSRYDVDKNIKTPKQQPKKQIFVENDVWE